MAQEPILTEAQREVLQTLTSTKHNVWLTGPPASGKSLVLSHLLRNTKSTVIYCSADMTPIGTDPEGTLLVYTDWHPEQKDIEIPRPGSYPVRVIVLSCFPCPQPSDFLQLALPARDWVPEKVQK